MSIITMPTPIDAEGSTPDNPSEATVIEMLTTDLDVFLDQSVNILVGEDKADKDLSLAYFATANMSQDEYNALVRVINTYGPMGARQRIQSLVNAKRVMWNSTMLDLTTSALDSAINELGTSATAILSSPDPADAAIAATIETMGGAFRTMFDTWPDLLCLFFEEAILRAEGIEPLPVGLNAKFRLVVYLAYLGTRALTDDSVVELDDKQFPAIISPQIAKFFAAQRGSLNR